MEGSVHYYQIINWHIIENFEVLTYSYLFVCSMMRACFMKYMYFQVGIAMVVVESAVTSIYICYAEDPLLIQRWDTEFFNHMSETLHQRLQHRSSRAREVLTHNQLDSRIGELSSIWGIFWCYTTMSNPLVSFCDYRVTG